MPTAYPSLTLGRPALLSLLAIAVSVSLATAQPSELPSAQAFHYTIDLTHTEDDLFHVALNVPPLTAADSIYSFTAFAPGVHQVLDFGRFVQSFEATDAKGAMVPTVRRSTNDWAISDPRRVAQIRYRMEDSFDADVEKHVIYPMSGTGIEPEYVAINSHGVFGYFVNRRDDPVTVQLAFDRDWTVGTALQADGEGRFVADSYYHLADSPILVGNLSTSSRQVGEIDVDAYVYSPIPEISADTVLVLANEVLLSAHAFVGYAPVDRYTFLMYFYDDEGRARNPAFAGGGALEHSYSSTYALPAHPRILPIIKRVIAHEFMHILTPLHLRSEIIAEFDYSRPTAADKHLWLYEGVTEWASGIMQLRSGLTNLDDYLELMSSKISASDRYESDWSLTRLSAEWFTDEGRTKYGDIYELGALTAMCLDLRLLELSNGERGLRDVFVAMMEKYGKDRPFNNESFFGELVAATYPEIRDFIDRHIVDRQPLDYARLLGLVGVRYTPRRLSADPTPQFGLSLRGGDDNRYVITGFQKEHESFGLQLGDTVLTVFDHELTVQNVDSVFALKKNLKAGDPYRISVRRKGNVLDLEGRVVPVFEYHVLEVDEQATEQMLRLRSRWLSNRTG